MIIQLFRDLLMLLFTPQKYWVMMNSRKTDENQFLERYFYPLLGITALSVFGGYYTRLSGLKTELVWVIICIVKYFFSFIILKYIAGYLCTRINTSLSKSCITIFVGGSLSVVMFMNIIANFVPGRPIWLLLSLYSVWPVLLGVKYYVPVPKPAQGIFALTFAILISLLPYLIGVLFHYLMPGF